MNESLHHDWENLFAQAPCESAARDQHRQRLKTRVLQAYDNQLAARPCRLGPKEIGRLLMKYKIPHVAAAAILVVCVVWLALPGDSRVFAVEEVVGNLMKVRSARYDATASVVGQPATKMKALFLEPGRYRQEVDGRYINIADWKAGKMIELDPASKQATVFNLVNMPADDKRKMQGNQFQEIREAMQRAVDDPDAKVEALGEQEIDGRTAVGFRFTTPLWPITLWADPETRLPIRIETTMLGPPQKNVVMRNYEFNVELDESLFSVEVPAGYKVTELDVDTSPPVEKDLVTALEMCSAANDDGEFPQGFDPAVVSKYIAMYLQKQGVTKEGPTAAQMKQAICIGRGFQFALMLPKEVDAHYAGEGAEKGDAKRAIFWYKPVDSTKYRVIYADLSVKEAVTAPNVPGATKLAP